MTMSGSGGKNRDRGSREYKRKNNVSRRSSERNTGSGTANAARGKHKNRTDNERYCVNERYYAEEGFIFGRNPVMEALKNGRRIEKIVTVKNSEGSIIQILAKAKDAGIPVHYADRKALDRMSGMAAHQGIGARVAPYDYVEVEDILDIAEKRGEKPFIVILDGIEDPHNFGAIMRSCDACGVHGIIIPKNRAVGITETVVKSSAGAVEYVPCAKAVNLVQTIKKLKDRGVWIAALDMDGEIYTKNDFKVATALVIGSEGNGVGKLVKENCDFTLAIPMMGKLNSLNASNACCVVLCEAMLQRRGLR